MKTLFIAACFSFILFVSSAVAGDTYVKGYYRKDGTYVQPHYRSDPDGNQYNNWSTKGNTNPYTGQPGYNDPYDSGYGRSNQYGPSYGSPYGGRGNLYKIED